MNINSKKSIAHNITFVACIALAGMCGFVYGQSLVYAQSSGATSLEAATTSTPDEKDCREASEDDFCTAGENAGLLAFAACFTPPHP